jgi:hypothetical protein
MERLVFYLIGGASVTTARRTHPDRQPRASVRGSRRETGRAT